MAAPSKAQFVNDVYTSLKSRYKVAPRPERMSVLEAVVYAICHEGTTGEQANQALSRFKDEFFDWNEVRVSSIREIQSILDGIPEPEARARLVRRFLRQLFNRTYSFTLEALYKKPLKDAMKTLSEFEAMKSDYVLSSVVQLALGGHAIPIDGPTLRALERLGLADGHTDREALRGSLERAVPKNRGGEFCDLMEYLAHDTCIEGEPVCVKCVLNTICPFALAHGVTGSGTRTKYPKDTKPADEVKAAKEVKPPAKESKGVKEVKPGKESKAGKEGKEARAAKAATPEPAPAKKVAKQVVEPPKPEPPSKSNKHRPPKH